MIFISIFFTSYKLFPIYPSSKITTGQLITHKNTWEQITHEFIFVFYHSHVNKSPQCLRLPVPCHAKQSIMTLGPQSLQDSIENMIATMAFSSNTFRKTYKDPSHALLNMAICWQLVDFFFLIQNKEISDQSVTLAFENVILGRKKEKSALLAKSTKNNKYCFSIKWVNRD